MFIGVVFALITSNSIQFSTKSEKKIFKKSREVPEVPEVPILATNMLGFESDMRMGDTMRTVCT